MGMLQAQVHGVLIGLGLKMTSGVTLQSWELCLSALEHKIRATGLVDMKWALSKSLLHWEILSTYAAKTAFHYIMDDKSKQ